MTKETEKQLDELWNTVTEQKKRIGELEKENTELKCECRTCVYTDSPCVRSDYPSKDGVCSHYKNVFDENAELRLKLEALEGQTPWKDIKDKSEVAGKLTKARELLTRFVMASVYFNGKETDLVEEAEQFLNSEVQRRELPFDHQAQSYVGE